MKKIISLLLVVSLTAAIAIGGTLAYLTDRDSEANVFTVGNVEIDLNEDFEQGAELIPGVTITKKPTVTNVGPNDAWVWATVSVPAGLDSVIDFDTKGATWEWSTAADVTIEGKSYKQYTVLYNSTEALAKGDVTTALFETVALDETVDIDPDGVWHTVVDGTASELDWTNADGNPTIYVSAYAIQSEGLTDENSDGKVDVKDAYALYNNQWADNGTENAAAPTLVATADELTAALNAGESVALTTDVELNDAPITIPANSDATLNLNGHTLSGKSTSTTTSNLIKVNKGASLTISNGTVSFSATNPDTDWDPEGFPGYANNTINNAGTLVIDGATIKNLTPAGGASYAIDNYPGANLIINDGVIDGEGKTAIRLFANSATVETNVTVNGGTITGSRAIWIHLPGSNPEEAPPVNVTITGGTLTSTNDPDSDNYMAIYSYSYGQSASGVNVNISGGTFNGNVGFGGGSKVGAENVTVTGGTFNGKLGRYLANDGWEDIAKP